VAAAAALPAIGAAASLALLRSLLAGEAGSAPASLVHSLRFHAALMCGRNASDGIAWLVRTCSTLGVPLCIVLSDAVPAVADEGAQEWPAL